VKLFGRELSDFSAALVILVAIFLTSAGLCGITAAFGKGLGDSLIALAMLEFLVMGLSLVGILIMLLTLPFLLIANARERRLQAEQEAASGRQASRAEEERTDTK
jgi:hypothetical protein